MSIFRDLLYTSCEISEISVVLLKEISPELKHFVAVQSIESKFQSKVTNFSPNFRTNLQISD